MLYRGTDSFQTFEAGQLFREPAFLSLTADHEVAGIMADHLEPGFIWNVRVPAGTPGGFPDGMGVSEGELEVLLGRGTILKVVSVQAPIHLGGFTRVTFEVIPR